MADAPYQSLYRRYRPQRFDEVRGQDHVTTALRNAVRDGRVAHGYLFSGPRGTGKTSSARILAKALNCAEPVEGEPCGACESCLAVQQGTSFDVHELDAASNNGVDAMRDLISRAALGTPGRWKVYIVDEVHMLSAAASNTLLKTLEEPPAHVVFVLATTEPQKVLPTIRSRVQHYQFGLLTVDDLSGLVAAVNADAGLGLSDTDLERVVRRGAGSARDSLSALDQAAALGGFAAEVPVADEVVGALSDRDPARALTAVAEGAGAGRDPRRLAEEILEHLRDAFLATRAPQLVARPAEEVGRLAQQAQALGSAALVRAMEVVGEALREMKDAIDPRISLEVAIVRMTAPEADTSPAALLERIERLERTLADVGGTGTGDARPGGPGTGAGGARGGAGATNGGRPPPPAPPPIPPRPRSRPTPPPTAEPAGAEGAALPDRDALTKAWGDVILANLRPRAKALFGAGRFVDVRDGAAVFALPNDAHRRNCEPTKADVERALEAHFRTAVPLRLVSEGDVPAGNPSIGADQAAVPPDDMAPEDLIDLEDAPAPAGSAAERVKQAFPGAEEIE